MTTSVWSKLAANAAAPAPTMTWAVARALPVSIAAGGLLFLSSYGALALWSKLDGSAQHTCTQELYVSRAGEISRGPLVLGRVSKDGTVVWSRDPKVIAAEHALEKAR